VMLMNPRRPAISNQRCSVSDFTLRKMLEGRQSEQRKTAQAPP